MGEEFRVLGWKKKNGMKKKINKFFWIFQRYKDDILRPYLGKFVYVYIDDVLI